MLFEIFSPYTDAIIYSDCRDNRIIDLSYNILTFTKSWCYVLYVRPLEKASFQPINLKPSERYLFKKIPDILPKTGH